MKKPLLYLLVLLVAVFSTSCTQSSKGTFEVGDKTFLLNGEPFVVKAAEIHYPRIPKEYWEHRIKMSKALGMNTICLYVFWNFHEPEEGKYDFTGQKDIAAFCRMAQENGMYVIVRPGPYVCAEWEMGGLPWWLLKKEDIKLREQDPYYMERVKLFMNEVGKQLADLQISKGGNIIMVQVENEYGSFGIDKPYIAAIRDMVKQAGFTGVPLFQCDWNSNFENNALDDLLWTVNFGTGANIDQQFERLKELRPNTPLMCSEFWSGWFDHWGAKHETRSAEELVKGMKEMLDRNISFSLYMTHGGTSFGHWGGANFPNFSPTCTSYDYDAPISILYRTTLPASKEEQTLIITEAHDWAQVFLNGKKLATLSRLKGEGTVILPPMKEEARLDILVEAMGRMNFGKGIYDWKGITEKVELQSNDGNITSLKDWQVYNIPVDYSFAQNKKYEKRDNTEKYPAYYELE